MLNAVPESFSIPMPELGRNTWYRSIFRTSLTLEKKNIEEPSFFFLYTGIPNLGGCQTGTRLTSRRYTNAIP